MKISIALATYNGAIYLQEQLDSYIAQERLPDEVVVCDDASTDYTVDMLEAFKKTAPFQVRVIKNQCNLGYTKNFEKALSNCSGDIILLSDQDDLWFPWKIRIIEESFINNPDKYLIIHDGELVDEDLVYHGATKLGQVLVLCRTDDFFITGALTSIRKEFIQYVLPIPNEDFGHDEWLHSIAKLMDKRLVIKQSMQLIRRHSQNTSSWIASSLKPIHRISVAWGQFSAPTPSSFAGLLSYNTSLIDRFNTIDLKDHGGIPSSTIRTAVVHLRKQRNAIICRDELIQLGFIRRKLSAVKMLTRGDYAHFNGLKSFMRDISR